MDRRSLALSIAAVVSLAASAGRAAAQSNPYAKLIGKWVMDTTNGPDDKGLPKSETLVFSRISGGIRITATEDDGQGPSTSGFNCLAPPSGGLNDQGKGQSIRCTVRPTADSVMYALDAIDSAKKTTPIERGRLVVQSNGLLRDQYDAMTDTPPTHHRHIYRKVS